MSLNKDVKRVENKDLSLVFDGIPKHWGLRGDPYLWEEMKASFVGKTLNIDTRKFAEQICKKYKKFVGRTLTYGDNVFVERFSHGGMSSGWVCGEFWICHGIPVLINRLRKTKLKYNIEPNMGEESNYDYET